MADGRTVATGGTKNPQHDPPSNREWNNGALITGNNIVFNTNDINNASVTSFLNADRLPLKLTFASSGTTRIERRSATNRPIGELRPGRDGIVITNGGNVVIDALVRIRSNINAQTWDTGNDSNANLTLLRNLDLQGNTLTFTGQGTTTIEGNIQGPQGAVTSGSLVKRGLGTLTLAGTGNYAGTTTINNGNCADIFAL